MTRGPPTIEINLPARVSRLTLTAAHNSEMVFTAEITATLVTSRGSILAFSIFHDPPKLVRLFARRKIRANGQNRDNDIDSRRTKPRRLEYDSDKSLYYFEKSMNAASRRERKRSGRLAAAAAMAPPFVPTNRANYVSLARPPRTGNETLPRVPLSAHVYTYICKRIRSHSHASDTPRYTFIYPTIVARLGARGSKWKRSWIKPGRGGSDTTTAITSDFILARDSGLIRRRLRFA